MDFNREWNYWMFCFWQKLYSDAPNENYKRKYRDKMEKSTYKLVDWNKLSQKIKNE